MRQPSLYSPSASPARQYSVEHDRPQDEQLAAVRTATADGLAVLALLGRRIGDHGRPERTAFLACDQAQGTLVVASVAEKLGAEGRYEITLSHELDSALAGPASTCSQCGRLSLGWSRYCACGGDLSGIAPTSRTEQLELLERVRQATAGEYEILGGIPYAGAGGLAYFAREIQSGAIVALRMHAHGSFDDGTPRFTLSGTEPLVDSSPVAVGPLSSPPARLAGPVHFTPVETISVVTEETAAREVVRRAEGGKSDEQPTPAGALHGSILGSGLLAQQPTPSGQTPVLVTKVCPQCGVEYDTASRFCPNDGTPLRPKGSTDPYVGHILAERYHILKRLGEGGMGKVYLAEHVKMNRQCAVKVMTGALVNDAESAQRFAREASNASRIIHPNVAAVFDYGESDGIVYLVMEYVEGESLTQLLAREGSLPPHRALDIARQVSEALVAAHELGIVHRDLKPDNIIITQSKSGREIAKVVDFGIAKALAEGPNDALTRTGLVIGTPEYMSPEQLLGDPVDARSDIYSLGCILYQMLTGRRTFEEPTREQMIKRRLTEKSPHARELVPELPKTLDMIVARMLARTPQDRYGTAIELRDLLIPGIALEGGFDDPNWRPRARSAPTVFIQAAEQPTQEITRQPTMAARRPVWRRATVIGSAAVLMLVIGLSAMVYARTGSASSDTTSVVPQVGPQVPPVPLPKVALLPTGKVATTPASPSAGASAKDTSTPLREKAKSPELVPEPLRHPIDSYAAAIQSGFVEQMVRVYPAMADKKDQIGFWDNFFDTQEQIKASVEYEGSDMVSPSLANVRFKLKVNSRVRQSRLEASQLNHLYRAELVKIDGAWKINTLEERR
jgi:eukaryotic-like serine/threonine-protein kinase